MTPSFPPGLPWKLLVENYNVVILADMTPLQFEWDKAKSKLNQEKHGVSFAEAETAFYDENARLIDDPDHSDGEERFVIMGFSIRLWVLIVCHCYRHGGDVILDAATKRHGDRAKKCQIMPVGSISASSQREKQTNVKQSFTAQDRVLL